METEREWKGGEREGESKTSGLNTVFKLYKKARPSISKSSWKWLPISEFKLEGTCRGHLRKIFFL